MMDQVTILVSTCDAYSACWMPFCHGLTKYWPEHPQELVFITNHKIVDYGRTLRVGEDKGWARNLLFALDQVRTPYVLYAQEDYWIDRPVAHANILDYLQIMQTGGVDYVRLYPAPRPSVSYPGDIRLGIMSSQSEYRASLQMALWRKSTLIELLNPDETPWQFEVQGTRRSAKFGDGFLSVWDTGSGISYVFTAVVSGEWSQAAYHYAATEALPIRFADLPKKPYFTRAKIRLHTNISTLYQTLKRKKRTRRS
jgi:hypothetical protein